MYIYTTLVSYLFHNLLISLSINNKGTSFSPCFFSLEMDRSCIDDQSTTSETISTFAPPTPAEMSLCRVGSGASVVLDLEGGVEVEAQSKKLPSSRFKGVVPQPNGRWGSQIYEKHQRVCIVKFMSNLSSYNFS